VSLKNYLARLAFAITHSTLGRTLVGWTFAHLSFALPVRRIRETPALIAFHHPRPSYPLHVLIVPKHAIPGLQALDEKDGSLLLQVFRMAGILIVELGLEGKGARLIVNGGAYQHIPQLHFHLIYDSVSDDSSRSKFKLRI
jgi:histidine triad (HIT) family protein